MSNTDESNSDWQGARAARESVDPARLVEGSVEPFDHADEVTRRAYELYEQRGGEHGHDWDDWFRAEQELRARTDDRV
jgi:hypothetical protein